MTSPLLPALILLLPHLATCLTGPLRRPFVAPPTPTVDGHASGVDPGDPLFLTPYLEAGRPDLARQRSLVGILNGTEVPKSYAGFLTVNRSDDSNMYFWFFPAKENPEKAPVLLWLQGGPGGPSLYGLFTENGPFYVDDQNQLWPRKVTWQTKYSMLYIDNPVGTGFSFTNSLAGYARNEVDVATNLYSALVQFFQIYQSYAQNDFYVTGESYAGKYIPAISYHIHKMNPGSKYKINLKGMAIGDGLCDPVSMMGYGELMYEIGLADELQVEHINGMSNQIKSLIKQKKFIKAFMVFDEMLNGDLFKYHSYFYNITGSTNYFNYDMSVPPSGEMNFVNYLALPDVRLAIHVGRLPFQLDDRVEKMLLADVMDSVKPWVPELLENYKVVFYNGQLDIIVAGSLTQNFLSTLDWSGKSDYEKAERYVWKIKPNDTQVAGYVRRAKNMYQVIIRGAGHMVPTDQPERALDMLERFIGGKYPWK